MKSLFILLLSALFVTFLSLTSAAHKETCEVEQTIVSQDTAQFLEYYGQVLFYNDYDELLPVKIVKDASLEYINYTTNLKKSATLNKMRCNNKDFIVCVVETDNSYEVVASYNISPSEKSVRENFGYFTSESDFLIHSCEGKHATMHINYKSFNFENIENSSFREYCKSLKDFEALIEPTNEPCKHKVCFGGVDSQGIEHYFTTFIINT